MASNYRRLSVEALEWLQESPERQYLFVKEFGIRHPFLFKKNTTSLLLNYLLDFKNRSSYAKSVTILHILNEYTVESVKLYKILREAEQVPVKTTEKWYFQEIYHVPLTKAQYDALTDSSILKDVYDDLHRIKKITNIKTVRELTGLGLREAKMIVDDLYEHYNY